MLYLYGEKYVFADSRKF